MLNTHLADGGMREINYASKPTRRVSHHAAPNLLTAKPDQSVSSMKNISLHYTLFFFSISNWTLAPALKLLKVLDISALKVA